MDTSITGWFTTDTGTHVPIHKGQTKAQAMRQFSESHDNLYNEWVSQSKNAMDELQKAYSDPRGTGTTERARFEEIDAKLSKREFNRHGDNNWNSPSDYTGRRERKIGDKYIGISSSWSTPESVSFDANTGKFTKVPAEGPTIHVDQYTKKGFNTTILETKKFSSYQDAIKYAERIK